MDHLAYLKLFFISCIFVFHHVSTPSRALHYIWIRWPSLEIIICVLLAVDH